MNGPVNVAELGNIAHRRAAAIRPISPSRPKWFALGAATGMLASILLFWIGIRVLPELSFAYREKPELRQVTPGMTYERVRRPVRARGWDDRCDRTCIL